MGKKRVSILGSENEEQIQKICQKYKADFMGVFGSVARNENTAQSDIDVLVRFSPESKTSLLGMVRMEEELKEVFEGKSVDLVTEKSLSPYMRNRVFTDLKPVYGSL